MQQPDKSVAGRLERARLAAWRVLFLVFAALLLTFTIGALILVGGALIAILILSAPFIIGALFLVIRAANKYREQNPNEFLGQASLITSGHFTKDSDRTLN